MLAQAHASYFVPVMLPETLLNVLDTFLPRFEAAVMMATEIRDAIRPYSMAVAPDSSDQKLCSFFRIIDPVAQ